MQYFNCPYCNYPIPLDSNYLKALTVDNNLEKTVPSFERNNTLATLFKLTCPSCQKTTLRIASRTNLFEHSIPVEPLSYAKPLPDYIPEHIQNDYKEACAIVYLSPKASAMMSRRCLESMIKDFWGTENYRLKGAIEAIEEKVEPKIFNALNNIKSFGDIGAHEKYNSFGIIDIKTDEAQLILNIVELFFKEWYEKSHEKETILNNADDIIKNKFL